MQNKQPQPDRSGRTHEGGKKAQPKLTAMEVFEDRPLDVNTVASLLGVDRKTVLSLIHSGALVAPKLGKGFQVWQRDLRSFREEQSRMASTQAELARRQKSDRGARWELIHCLACGVELAFSTRHQRMDGDAFCSVCTGDGRAEKALRSKDYWERKVALEVNERNQQELESRENNPVTAAQSFQAGWFIDYCVICNRPYALSYDQVRDYSFFPDCMRAEPFLGHGSYPHLREKDDPRVLAHLSDIEVRERNKRAELLENLTGDSSSVTTDLTKSWRCPCASCGNDLAVATLEDWFVGKTRCRTCGATSQPVDRFHRANTIVSAVRAFSKDSALSRRCSCGCSNEVVVFTESGQRLRCSWCTERTYDERAGFIKDFLERYSLPESCLASFSSYIDDISDDDIPF